MHVCLYCQNHCEANLFAQEPVWSCSWCRAAAHVRCYHDFHAHALASAAAAEPSAGKEARADSGQEAGPLKLPDLTGLGGREAAPARRHGRYVAIDIDL